MKKLGLFAGILGFMIVASSVASAAKAKNVILMISDGWGYNQIAATNYWTEAKSQGYESFTFKSAMTTYSASNTSGYDPSKAWANGNPDQAYLKTGATDSAAAITAMVTGVKTYDGKLNWSTSDLPLKNITQYAKEAGKSAGAVSTVNWTHATPAGMGAHSSGRSDYAGIANEMIKTSGLDVIMGAGNPFYNNNGAEQTANYNNVGGVTLWNSLVDGTAGYSLIQDRSAFQGMATGNTPNKVVGTFKAYDTAQERRSGYLPEDLPGNDPLNINVPTLSEMSLAALNVLDNNSQGFVLTIEGGAIDWANHAKEKSRLIEEQMDFNSAVNSVFGWIGSNGGWDQNLLIVTGDHETGMLLGPNGETDVLNLGKDAMPGMEYFSGSHTNSLIPLFAQGAGSDLFAQYQLGYDPVRGKYIDNTDVFKVMQSQVVPEPSSIMSAIVIVGTLSAAFRRKK